MRVLNPIFTVGLLFACTHLLFGFNVYLHDDKLTWLTLSFILGVALGSLPFISKPRAFAISHVAIEVGRPRTLQIRVTYVLLAIKLLFFLRLFSMPGVSYQNARELISKSIPLQISLPLDSAVAALFLLAAQWIILSAPKEKVKLRLYTFTFLCTGVYLLSGSRSFALFFPFSAALLLGQSGLISFRRLLFLVVLAPLLIGGISLFRILLGDNQFQLEWYLSAGIIDGSSPIVSAMRLAVFQIQEMVQRSALIVDGIPSVVPFQNGKSVFFGFTSMLPGRQINPAVLIHHQLFAEGVNPDAPFPPTMVPQLYLDFGSFGPIVGGIVLGVISNIAYQYTRATKKTANVALLITLTYFMALSLYGDFETLRLTMIASLVFFLSKTIMVSQSAK